MAVFAVSAADNATDDIVNVEKTSADALSISDESSIAESVNNGSEKINVNSDDLLSDLADEVDDEYYDDDYYDDEYNYDEDDELYLFVEFPQEVSSGKCTFVMFMY